MSASVKGWLVSIGFEEYCQMFEGMSFFLYLVHFTSFVPVFLFKYAVFHQAVAL
jgi:hypothetical protein